MNHQLRFHCCFPLRHRALQLGASTKFLPFQWLSPSCSIVPLPHADHSSPPDNSSSQGISDNQDQFFKITDRRMEKNVAHGM